MTTNNLTEQWKKGELKEGEEYWVILTKEWYLRNPVEPVRAFYSCDCEFEGYYDDDIKEVLAPVPSYEEWKELKEFADYSLHNRNELTRQITFWMDKHTQSEKENQKLKELLKECSEQLDEYSDLCLQEGYEIEREVVLKLKTKIDNALGVDK